VELEGPAAAIDRAAENWDFRTRLCLNELSSLVHGRLPPQRRGTAPHGLSERARDPPISHSNKKNRFESPFFLDFAKRAAYQSNCDCNFVISGVNFLSNECGQRTRTWLLVGPG